MTNVNNVTLQGIIVHKFVTDKVTILTINTGNATKERNFPKVVCFNELKDVAASFEVYDKVRVEGYLQSSKYNEKIKNQSTLSIFAEKVEKAQGVIEDAFDEKVEDAGYVPYINRFEIAGELVRVVKVTDTILRLTVRTFKNKRPSFVRLTYFTRSPETIEKVALGTQVFAVGNTQTTKKDFDGETRHFVNYVATSLSFATQPAESTKE